MKNPKIDSPDHYERAWAAFGPKDELTGEPISRAMAAVRRVAKQSRERREAAQAARDALFRGTDKSNWRFWEHGVTSSFLGSYQTCREQTRLHYCEGWSGTGAKAGIDFGQTIHQILEWAYAKPAAMREVVKSRADRRAWAKAMVTVYEKMWNKAHPRPTQSQAQLMQELWLMAEMILPIYLHRWAGDWTGKYPDKVKTAHPKRWLSLEQTFRVPFKFDDGREIPIRGRRDGVFETRKGNVFVFDTKCYSVINLEDIMAALEFDLQQWLYLWVTWKESGRCPDGTVMNIVRRPAMYRRKDETMKDYVERVRQDVADTDRYDWYFKRIQMEVTKKDVQKFEDTKLRPLLTEVRMWWEGKIPHYLNDKGLSGKYGVTSLYPIIARGDTSGFLKRPIPFAELEEVK